MYENRVDSLSNNLRLNEISILIFFQFYFKINRNQLQISVKATYGLHSDKHLEILNLTFWGRSLVTRHFGLYLNSRGSHEIKDLPILIHFCNRNTGLLLLFSIISPCFYTKFLIIPERNVIFTWNLNENKKLYSRQKHPAMMWRQQSMSSCMNFHVIGDLQPFQHAISEATHYKK